MDKRVSMHFETKFELFDKAERWFELRVEQVPQGIFILSVDITIRKKEELYKLRYLNELEEMIFITSHKVRRPITNLFGLSKMLQKSSNSPEKFKKIAGFILDSVKSLDLFTIELTKHH